MPKESKRRSPDSRGRIKRILLRTVISLVLIIVIILLLVYKSN